MSGSCRGCKIWFQNWAIGKEPCAIQCIISYWYSLGSLLLDLLANMISWSVCKRVNQACHGADITGKSRSLMGNCSDVQCCHVVRPRDVTALTGVLAVVDGGALTQIAPDRGRCRKVKGLLTQIAPDRNRTVGGKYTVCKKSKTL